MRLRVRSSRQLQSTRLFIAVGAKCDVWVLASEGVED